jgi:hypothetical protein
VYSVAVAELYKRWKDDNKIDCSKMTPMQAKEFVELVENSKDPMH